MMRSSARAASWAGVDTVDDPEATVGDIVFDVADFLWGANQGIPLGLHRAASRLIMRLM